MSSDCEQLDEDSAARDERLHATGSKAKASGWQMFFFAIQMRMRFAIVLVVLASFAAGWPWITTLWERVLARLNPYSTDATVASGTDYFCPMDPGVVSDWPAICPVCNMDLIQRQKSDSQVLPSGVLARMQISPYRISLAGIRTVPVEARLGASVGEDPPQEELVVPTTAVVFWESDTVVYVESMPGMFDAVPISIARREGSKFVVRDGLKAGQQVVTMGTLLVDAESRLHPHLSTQYFGAAAQATNAPPKSPSRATTPSLASLGLADAAIVVKQRYCPVTQAQLGSMGTPVFVEVLGRRVALCCEGCRKRVAGDPKPFLNWLDERLANEPSTEEQSTTEQIVK